MKNILDEKPFEKRFDFENYSVIVRKHSLFYVVPDKEHETMTTTIPTHFNITVDEEKNGGKIEIKFINRWGSEMIFKHYAPTSLKGMFDFIGKGYNVFKTLKIEV